MGPEPSLISPEGAELLQRPPELLFCWLGLVTWWHGWLVGDMKSWGISQVGSFFACPHFVQKDLETVWYYWGWRRESWLGLEDKITEETILGHRKGEGKKVEALPDFGHSRESIRHTLHRVFKAEWSMVWELPSDAPRPALPQPPSHVFSLPIELLLQLPWASPQHPLCSLRVTHGLQLLGQDGQGTVPAPAAPGSATWLRTGPQPLTAKLAEPLRARRSCSRGGRGHISGLPSLTQGSQGPLKFVQGVLTTSILQTSGLGIVWDR